MAVHGVQGPAGVALHLPGLQGLPRQLAHLGGLLLGGAPRHAHLVLLNPIAMPHQHCQAHSTASWKNGVALVAVCSGWVVWVCLYCDWWSG